MILNKKQKKLRASLHGGIGAVVIDNDLSMALSLWRAEIKKSGLIQELYRRKEYIKPSKIKKDDKSKARYKQKKITDSQK